MLISTCPAKLDLPHSAKRLLGFHRGASEEFALEFHPFDSDRFLKESENSWQKLDCEESEAQPFYLLKNRSSIRLLIFTMISIMQIVKGDQ